MYTLGIDLGTTFTAAATWRDGHAEIAPLGSRSSAIPSVVLLREDETFMTGEAAERRAITEPHRVAREFKRRLGDTTPLLLGGVPYSAEALMARLLRSVLDEVTKREGGAPSAVCVCHPANWGPYKTDLLRQAVRIGGVDGEVRYTTEPEAAAAYYAQQQRIEPGALVAVYDLGGGTFDAAVLRKTVGGFQILGQPEGIERLGGIDFDAAVFSHVGRAIGGKLAELDEDDPTAVAAVARLREECVRAKEALSSDTDTSIPVLLPNLSTEVRLTRAELEAMVRPALHDTIEALRRALRSAGVTPEQLHSVLLVGGSSRMPLVAQMVGAELGRPVAVDAHPKHVVSLGAAWLASGAAAAPVPPTAPTGGPPPARGRAVASVPVPTPVPPAPAAPPVPAPAPAFAASPRPAQPPYAVEEPTQYVAEEPTQFVVAEPTQDPVEEPPRFRAETEAAPPRRRTGLLVVAGAALVVVLAAAGGAALALANRDDGKGGPGAGGRSPEPVAQNSAPASPAAEVPLVQQCTDAIKANPRWVCLTKATLDGEKITIEYQASNGGSPFNVNGGYHLHIYGADETGTNPPDRLQGTHASGGHWYVEDKNPSVRLVTSAEYKTAIGPDAAMVCARIADARHRLVADTSGAGTYQTGNCVPITRAP